MLTSLIAGACQDEKDKREVKQLVTRQMAKKPLQVFLAYFQAALEEGEFDVVMTVHNEFYDKVPEQMKKNFQEEYFVVVAGKYNSVWAMVDRGEIDGKQAMAMLEEWAGTQEIIALGDRIADEVALSKLDMTGSAVN